MKPPTRSARRSALGLSALLALALPASLAAAEPSTAEQSRRASEARLQTSLEAQGSERALQLLERSANPTPAALDPAATQSEVNEEALVLGAQPAQAPAVDAKLTPQGESVSDTSQMMCEPGYHRDTLNCRVTTARPAKP